MRAGLVDPRHLPAGDAGPQRMKGRHRRSHLTPGKTPHLLPRADPRRQLRHTRHHALAARPAQHQRHPDLRVVPQRLQILQTRHRQPLRLIHHQHPSPLQGTGDPLISLRRTVGKPARQHQSLEHRPPQFRHRRTHRHPHPRHTPAHRRTRQRHPQRHRLAPPRIPEHTRPAPGRHRLPHRLSHRTHRRRTHRPSPHRQHPARHVPRRRGLPPCRRQRGRNSRGTNRRRAGTDTRDGEVRQSLPGLPLSPRPGYRGTLRQHPPRRQLTLHRPVHRSRRHPRNPVPALLQIPVQHRHIAARLRQHLPRLLRQLEPGTPATLHTALTARRLHPPPHRPRMHPRQLRPRPHMRRRHTTSRIQLKQPPHQHRPRHRDQALELPLPHPILPGHPPDRRPPSTRPPRKRIRSTVPVTTTREGVYRPTTVASATDTTPRQ